VEAEGYEVEVLSIPACAVNAPHRRERYWIVGRHVANTEGNRPGGTDKHEMSKFYRRDQIRISTTRTSQGDLADTGRSRREGIGNTEARPRLWNIQRASITGNDIWQRFVWLPCADGKVRRSPDHTFGLVDGLHRSLLSALGNSIVPQVAARVIAAMVKCDHIGDANEMVEENE
jgi:hypothetical protein